MGDLSQSQKKEISGTSWTGNPFLSLQHELDKTMRNFYRIFDLAPYTSREIPNLRVIPSVDIIEDDKEFKIEAEMPGMGEEDIKVSVQEGMLTLAGEKETSKKDEGKNYLMREIEYGCYQRNISLPENLDIDKTKATFRKGMVWISIPKEPGTTKQSKEIKVEKA